MAALGWLLNLDFAGGAPAVTLASTALKAIRQGPLVAHWLWWIADDAGDVTYRFEAGELRGRVIRVVTAPLQPAPSANYDVVLSSVLGNDLAAGSLANRSATATEQVWLYDALSDAHHRTPATHCRYSLEVTNAGGGGAGLVVLYCWLGASVRP